MDKTTNIPTEGSFLEQFKSHPESVGENYWTHLLFAFRFGTRMIGVGLGCILHGLLPPVFMTTGSDFIRKMHKEITERQG